MVSRTRLQWLALGAGGALACAALCWQHREARRQAAARPGGESLQEPLRQLDRGAGVLALAVAADSTLEHCRGDFRNRAMYAPLLSSGLSLLAGSRRLREALPQAHRLRDAIALGSVLTGLAGTGFHLWNVARRPGGIGWSNLFYAAPLGAPAALVLSGLLGGCAERLRHAPGDGPPRAFGLPAGRALALMSAAGLLGTSAEAGLLHFRGAFQNPAMFLPVSAPRNCGGWRTTGGDRHEHALSRLRRPGQAPWPVLERADAPSRGCPPGAAVRAEVLRAARMAHPGGGILPQPSGRSPVPLAAMLDARLFERRDDGYRDSRLPPLQQAWRRGLVALEAEARARHGRAFAKLAGRAPDALLRAMQDGRLDHPAWGGMPAALFFYQRLLHDITSAYYSHPTAWSEIGFGGPASPRGYVRLGANARDPWEPAEARAGREGKAVELNRRVR